MGFEKFNKKQILKDPAITIRKNGSISFNAYAVKEFPLKGKKFVALFFDQEEKAIGIQPTDGKSDPSAFQISLEKGKTPTIYCGGFLRACGIPHKEGSKVYPAEWDAKRGMVILKLN